jgi:lipoprotein-releasing system permease protein
LYFYASIFYLKASLFIVRKLINAPQKAFSAMIMRISIIATCISVAAMILASSFVNGFQQVVADKIFSFWGHIRIEHYEPIRSTNAEAALIQRNDSVKQFLQSDPRIQSVSSFVTHSAVLSANSSIEGIVIKGVSNDYPVENIQQYIRKGTVPNWQDSSSNNQILLSAYTANQLKLSVGNELLVYFISKNTDLPKVRKMRIAGIFNTGIDIYDQSYAIGNLDYLNNVNQLSQDEINGYEITLKKSSTLDETANTIFPVLPVGWNAITLKELSPEIFDWLALQDTNKFVFMGLMLAVALINMISCLIILLLERSNMIAILKSFGTSDRTIRNIFLLYGTWIGGVGIIAGSIVGIGLCLIQQHWPFIQLNEEVYYVSTAPVLIDWTQIMAIIIGTVAVTMLTLLIPAAIGKKINISKTLQFK